MGIVLLLFFYPQLKIDRIVYVLHFILSFFQYDFLGFFCMQLVFGVDLEGLGLFFLNLCRRDLFVLGSNLSFFVFFLFTAKVICS